MGFKIENGVLKKYTVEPGVTEVVILDGVTSIGDSAFEHCSSLTAVTIPDSVTSIGREAFDKCKSLTNVTIGNSVTSIGNWAFKDCRNLTAVTIGNSVTSIGDRAFDGTPFYENDKREFVIYGKVLYKYKGNKSNVTIPDSVTSIGYEAFKYCRSLTAVTIPDSVTSIGYSAFDGTPFYENDKREFVIYGKVLYKYKGNKSNVTIPDSVTSIGKKAFEECDSLTSVVIPNSVTSIGYGAFWSCSSLTSVTIPDSVTSIEDSAFYWCKSLTSVTIPDSVTSIGNYAFYKCEILTSVTIPDNVTSIGYGAFEECKSLTTVTIPDSVTSIGDRAFSGCESLTVVTIGNSVTSIGDWTFSGCESLTTVVIGKCLSNLKEIPIYNLEEIIIDFENTYFYSEDNIVYSKDRKTLIGCAGKKEGEIIIPDSVINIENGAFRGCKGFADNKGFVIIRNVLYSYHGNDCEVIIPDSVTSIGDWVFYECENLTSITIPDSVTSIGKSAFDGCSNLTTVTIPDSVMSIGESAFYWCKSLTNVTIGNSVTSIGKSAFDGCSNLTTVTIPDSVTSIGEMAFDECECLTVVTIPDSVTSIGYRAFSGCESLTSVTIPDSVTSIGDRAFSGCESLTSVTIPDSVTSIGESAFSCCKCLISVTIGNSVTSIGDSAFSSCSNLTSVTIPDSVTSIGGSAFKYCKSLTAVTIPDSVTSIENDAFYECKSLTSVTIPDNVTSIGDWAFSHCSSLTAVTIPSNVTSIGDWAFCDCRSLTSVAISDSVKSIGDEAFRDCKGLADDKGLVIVRNVLYSYYGNDSIVTIPDSVTRIEKNAFDSCEKLQYIFASSNLNIFKKLNSGNPLVIERSGDKYRFYATSFKSENNNYKEFINNNLWNEYDLELINNGPKYKYRLPARLFGGLDRLLNPVDLTDENRQLYIELLKKNVKKMIALAEEINCPFAVKSLIELGIIDDSNVKAVKKVIASSSVPEIAALAEMLGSEPPKTSTKKAAAKKTEPEAPADPLTAEYKEKFAAIKGKDLIKKMKLVGTEFPKVKLKDGTNAPDELFRFIVASYGVQDEIHIDAEADKAAGLLSYESLCDAINKISKGLDLSLYPSLLPVVCRFGNTEQIKAVIKYYDTLRGAKGKSVQYKIRSAMVLSDIRVAVLWIEKNGYLYEFAAVRDITKEQAYDKYLFDFGFDEQGKRVFDLETTTIEATISPELTLSLVNTATGKNVRSIPKKNVAPDVQKKAADELADLKATMKNAARLKNNQLYQDYLEATEFSSAEWTERYTKNPFLYAIARLLVWSQDKKTFTLADKKPVSADGQEYTLTDKPIKLAHPMEMDKAEVTAWQKYLADNKLKQPFAQIWEPVVDKTLFKESRYEGCLIRDFYLKNHEKMGISIEWYTFEYAERHYLSINGFDVNYERVMVTEDNGDETDRVEITSIKPKKWNRRVNMVLAFLDKITVYGRIKKDDVSVMQQMGRYTLPTIIDFISMAQEAGAVNVTAALLEYRNNTYPDYNVMDEFVLDW